jgi:hypothetical protein
MKTAIKIFEKPIRIEKMEPRLELSATKVGIAGTGTVGIGNSIGSPVIL